MKRTRDDATRIASIHEALRATQGDWHDLTNLWSIGADLDWLLSRAEALLAITDLYPAIEGRFDDHTESHIAGIREAIRAARDGAALLEPVR